jgi:hypothetical protein
MVAYWILYAVAAILALSTDERRGRDVALWVLVGLLFVLAIGLRHKVGGDWFQYLNQYRFSLRGLPTEPGRFDDPGYVLLNWVMGQLGWGVYGVNTVAGAIFITGLVVFCRRQPSPWLGFAVAVPYVVIVMAMGYTRQNVALGFFFLALAANERGKFVQYILWLSVGATFHKSAVLLIPLGIFLYGKHWSLRVAAVVATAYGLWDLLLAPHQERLWQSYVEQQMESQGAKIRVAMNLVPSLLILLYRKTWKRLFPVYDIWFWMAIGSLISLALVGYATTAVDRISLYFTVLQVVVFSRLPLLMRGQIPPEMVRFSAVAAYAAVLFVWLNYATHARYWLPYRNILFE